MESGFEGFGPQVSIPQIAEGELLSDSGLDSWPVALEEGEIGPGDNPNVFRVFRKEELGAVIAHSLAALNIVLPAVQQEPLEDSLLQGFKSEQRCFPIQSY